VSKSAASTSGAAGRYASAIFDLAVETNAVDALESDFATLNTLIDDSDDLSRVVNSPAYSRADQSKAMSAILSKAGSSDLTSKFVSLMISKGRLSALPGAIAGFTEMLADHRGETVAEVTSAKPLSDAQRDTLAANLKSSFGKDVKIDASVDPSLLGGLIVKVGSKMIDSSLKTKLAGLQLAMKAS
jgi:F-type H+-transporting ATPase subunit delta